METKTELVEKTMANLEKRQFKPYYVSTKEEVLPLVKTLINEGDTVANGGSVTLNQTGVTDYIKSGKFNYLEVPEGADEKAKKDAYRQRFFADVFFSSANAIIQDGRIYNEDGASTRVAPIIYGPDKVIIVAGINKIVKTEKEAFARVKWVAPQNCRKMHFETPCAEDLKCHNCFVPMRSCCTTAILNFSRIPDRITVILVGESLGV